MIQNSKHNFSEAAKKLRGSPMFQLLKKAKYMEAEGRDIVHFEIGDTSFDTPKHIKQAAIDSLKAGDTHYTTSYGLNDLRDEICNYIERQYNFKPTRDQVIITPGISIIYYAARLLVNPGEEIIVPDPAFSSYFSAFDFVGVKTVSVPLKESNEFRMKPEDVKNSISNKTKLVFVNSPHNPTGAVMSESDMRGVAKLVKDNNLYLVSDETYDQMVYDVPFFSPAVYDQCKERTIILNTFSKVYSMTGWRLGWAVGPEEIIKKMSLMVETVLSCVPPFIQRGGVAALNGDQTEIRQMIKSYKEKRDIMVNGLNSIPGISCVMPQGAFYALPNITKTGMTSQEFADKMLGKAGVALLPATNFGKYGEGYVRICYAGETERIHEGLRRLKSVL